jgi:ADP-heptose:LPS heptosyltransferase
MKKILVIRFSAMGDVVLLVPVLRSLVAFHNDVEVTVVTRPKFASFFKDIDRVSVFEADVDSRYKGPVGIGKLFTALGVHNFNLVIDMHDHIRTMLLRNLFKLFGKKVIVFKKGRKEKKAFTRRENKITKPLPHTTERYRAAFEKAGFTFPMVGAPHLHANEEAKTILYTWLEKQGLIKTEKWIGLAPFGMHKSKIWPLANYPAVIDAIIKKMPAKFFLFGGGKEETRYFEDLKQLFPKHCAVVAGQLKMPQEIALMQELDLMVCIDSSNMHLAALSGAPLLSIWGGTHPDLGFGPLGKGSESILQIDRKELGCRPCSVFGKETCYRGDFACLNYITTNTVVERILDRVNQ